MFMRSGRHCRATLLPKCSRHRPAGACTVSRMGRAYLGIVQSRTLRSRNASRAHVLPSNHRSEHVRGGAAVPGHGACRYDCQWSGGWSLTLLDCRNQLLRQYCARSGPRTVSRVTPITHQLSTAKWKVYPSLGLSNAHVDCKPDHEHLIPQNELTLITRRTWSSCTNNLGCVRNKRFQASFTSLGFCKSHLRPVIGSILVLLVTSLSLNLVVLHVPSPRYERRAPRHHMWKTSSAACVRPPLSTIIQVHLLFQYSNNFSLPLPHLHVHRLFHVLFV